MLSRIEDWQMKEPSPRSGNNTSVTRIPDVGIFCLLTSRGVDSRCLFFDVMIDNDSNAAR